LKYELKYYFGLRWSKYLTSWSTKQKN